jgi:hypothetical protein
VSRGSIFTLASYFLYLVSYSVFLWVTYFIYEGGQEFTVEDIPQILIFITAPVFLASIVAVLFRFYKSHLFIAVFYWCSAVFSLIGMCVNLFAAYLAWWSTLQ